MIVKNIFYFIAAALLIGCSGPTEMSSAKKCNARKYDVYLYPTNRSRIDSIANFKLFIDDSLYVNSSFRQWESSSEFFYKKVPLCEGAHLIKSKFGRYSRDTTFTINGESSIIFLMNHETAYTYHNGLRVALLKRDSTAKSID